MIWNTTCAEVGVDVENCQQTDGDPSTAEINETFLELLAEILDEDWELFAIDFRCPSDIQEKYYVIVSVGKVSILYCNRTICKWLI
jgi:hypothetical protein